MASALWRQLLSERAAILHVIRDVALYKAWTSLLKSPHLQIGAHSGIDFLVKALGRKM